MDKERKKDTPNKLTIVGGQPLREGPAVFSTNIEKLLLKASTDKDLKESLLQDRNAVLHNSEYSLNHQDKMILMSIPTLRLEDMIKRFSIQRTSRRTFLKGAAATVALLATGCISNKTNKMAEPTLEPGLIVYKSYHTEGHRPDIPDMPDETPIPQEMSPTAVYYMISEWTLENLKTFNKTEINRLKSLLNKEYKNKKEFIDVLISLGFTEEQREMILIHSEVKAYEL